MITAKKFNIRLKKKLGAELFEHIMVSVNDIVDGCKGVICNIENGSCIAVELTKDYKLRYVAGLDGATVGGFYGEEKHPKEHTLFSMLHRMLTVVPVDLEPVFAKNIV